MRVQIIAALIAVLAPAASAEPVIKLINFTADWCPNCRIIDPRIAEALERFPAGEIEYVELDMTAARRASPAVRDQVLADAIMLAGEHKAAYLWDWYGGLTGISVIISADTGEPISCVMRPMEVSDIEFRLLEAKILSLRLPAGERKPDGPDCPAPGSL
ncbi:MAG: thioredoxin family protein [Hyphomonadaceae bacterium]|nr:thioredoxin family protein [Hyphomonadaceae bacterium]